MFIQPAELMDKLEIQLQESGNWSMKMRAGSSESVVMRILEEVEKQDQVFMSPSGYLELRQNLIPLNKTIEKLGNSYLTTGTRYEITNFAFGTGEPMTPNSRRMVQDYFSRGHFEELADSEKLSTPDFELMTAGVEIVPAEVLDIPAGVEDMHWVANDFEDIIIEESGITRQKATSLWQGEGLMRMSGGRKLKDVKRAKVRYGVVEEMPDPPGKAYKILSKDALESPETLKAQYFSSYSGAKEFLYVHWPEEQQGAWQILQTEAEEKEEVMII